MDCAAGEVADAKLQDPVEVIREDVPAVGGAAQDEDLPRESDWQNADPAARLSAAGAAPAARDVSSDASLGKRSGRCDVMVNPANQTWKDLKTGVDLQKWHARLNAMSQDSVQSGNGCLLYTSPSPRDRG